MKFILNKKSRQYVTHYHSMMVILCHPKCARFLGLTFDGTLTFFEHGGQVLSKYNSQNFHKKQLKQVVMKRAILFLTHTQPLPIILVKSTMVQYLSAHNRCFRAVSNGLSISTPNFCSWPKFYLVLILIGQINTYMHEYIHTNNT